MNQLTKNPRSNTTAPTLIALAINNLILKVSDWRLWAYTGGRCLTYKSQQRIGAVFTFNKNNCPY